MKHDTVYIDTVPKPKKVTKKFKDGKLIEEIEEF